MSLDKNDNQPLPEKPPSRKGTRKGKELLEMMDQEAKGRAASKKPEMVRKRSNSAKRNQPQ